MKNRKRALALAGSAVLAVGLLAGCGTAAGGSGPTAGPGGGASEGTSSVWKAERLKIDGPDGYMSARTLVDGRLYFSSGGVWQDDGSISPEELWSAPLEGGKAEKLSGYSAPERPEGLEDYRVQINAIAPAKDGLWLYETVNGTRYELPEGFSGDEADKYEYAKEVTSSRLLLLDRDTAQEKLSVELDKALEAVKTAEQDAGESVNMSAMCSDAEGNLCVLYDQSAAALFDAQGEFLGAQAVPGWWDTALSLADGRAAIAGRGDEGHVLRPVDFKAKALGPDIALPRNADNVWSGGGGHSFSCVDGLYIYGLDAGTGKSTRLAGLLDCGIDANRLAGVYFDEGGELYCVVNDYDTEKSELYRLSELSAEEAAKLVTLRLACNYLSPSLSKAVLEFNTSSRSARIEVTDYSQYATDEDYSAGVTKLNTEILSGNVPDLFVTTDLPMARYAAKGLLKDIYELIDKDSELSRDSFMAPVLRAVETEGKLYSVAPGFGITTLVGKSEVVGREPGWTLAQMQEVVKAHPEAKYILGQGMTRSSVLDSMLRYGLDRYVDWQKGECSFNSPDFIDVLNFSRLFSEEFVYEELGVSPYQLMAEGRQLLMPYELRDFRDYQTCVAVTKGGATFKGYPTAEGVGNLITLSGDPLSISATCRNMDAAWSFVRGMLTEDYAKGAQYIDGLPLNCRAYDAAEAEAMKKDTWKDPDTGKEEELPAGTIGWGDFTIDFYAMTKEEAQGLRALIDSTTRTAAYDKNIMDIINEELQAFTSNVKTAEQTAALIQDRVSLYVNEQR